MQTFSVKHQRQKDYRPTVPDGYKLSIEQFFVEKIRDIVGLYLNTPDKEMVLRVDRKTQI